MNLSLELSAIRNNNNNYNGVNQHLINKTNDLFDFNIDFINEYDIIFIIISILSILISISAIFYLDLKRLNRAIFFVVLNFLFVVGEIALITSSFLSLSKFQIHNQITINSFKKYNDNNTLSQILIFLSTKIFNSSQTHIISIICLFIALSILKFVTIPITLLTLWPSSNHRITPTSYNHHDSIISNNNK